MEPVHLPIKAKDKNNAGEKIVIKNDVKNLESLRVSILEHLFARYFFIV